MAFESITEFLKMGNHGVYVWSAYGIGLAVVLYNMISPKLLKKKLVADLKRRERREQV
jgi:heme exporter protein D